jgi:hypothetical protein
VAAFGLRQPGLQRLGEVAPEAVEPRVHHLKHAAARSGLIAVEIELGLGCVGVAPICKTLQHAERDERIEEVAGAALVQSERLAQLGKVHRPARGKAREEAELDRTQERLRAPECAAELEDLVGRNGRRLRHGGSFCGEANKARSFPADCVLCFVQTCGCRRKPCTPASRGLGFGYPNAPQLSFARQRLSRSGPIIRGCHAFSPGDRFALKGKTRRP